MIYPCLHIVEPGDINPSAKMHNKALKECEAERQKQVDDAKADVVAAKPECSARIRGALCTQFSESEVFQHSTVCVHICVCIRLATHIT